MQESSPDRRVLLLIPTTTYRVGDFLRATEQLDIQVVVGCERRQALSEQAPGHTLELRFSTPEQSLEIVREFAGRHPLDAVIGTDDESAVLAAMASEALGLPHNPVSSVIAARDKYETRTRFAAAGLRSPRFQRVSIAESPQRVAARARYPCVIKPLNLSASRGVLRADDPESLIDAFGVVVDILQEPDLAGRAADRDHLLIEDYLPGIEVALEGLLERGELRVLALFDKPDPLEGPTFEETLLITPSGLPATTRSEIESEVARSCAALGLREGPVHAELRLHRGRPWMLEVAPRSIGGLCARALRFGTGRSLEEVILRQALGLDVATLERERAAAGVMMIPIPRPGVLRGVRGLEEVRAMPGVEEVTLTIHRGAELVPLPRGHSYLGFIFARSDTAGEVESILRRAHAILQIDVQDAPGA